MGDSNLVVNCWNGRWKLIIKNSEQTCKKTQNLLDRTEIRPMADHLGLFLHVYRVGMKKLIVTKQGRRELAGTR